MEQTELENQAMLAVIEPLADYVTKVGSKKTLFDYTKPEIGGLIETVIFSYQAELKKLYSDEIPF